MNKQFRVIIADDEESQRAVVKKMLLAADLGFTEDEIGEASTGAELCVLVAEHPVVLVVTDCHMPDGNGDDAISWIKTNHPNIKTVLMTGKPWEVRQRPPKESPDVMLIKPFHMTELTSAVQKLVSQAA